MSSRNLSRPFPISCASCATSARRRVSLTVEDGRIARIYAIRHPHKLARLEEVAELRR